MIRNPDRSFVLSTIIWISYLPVNPSRKNISHFKIQIMLLYLIHSVILIVGSGERIYAKVIAEARTKKLVPHPKAKVNPATVN